MSLSYLLFFGVMLSLSEMVRATTSNKHTTLSKACFVPPGSPKIGSGIKGSSAFHTMHTRINGRTFTTQFPSSLEAKKAGAGGTSASKKIQVKLLKHVKGTGQAGDVVLVSPAYFNNALRPTKSAEVISDDQVKLETQKRQADEQVHSEQASNLHSLLTGSNEDGSSFKLIIATKAGPEGQLFGGIGAKTIMEELKKQVPHPFWKEQQKGAKIIAMHGADGKKMRGDIKHLGDFSVSLAITKDITSKFPIVIVPED